MREGVGKKLGRVWATKFDPYKCVNTVQKLLFFALCLCLLFIQAKKCIGQLISLLHAKGEDTPLI